MKLSGPIWLMQPIPYFGEKLKGDWIIEPKIDGWRMQLIKDANGKVECWGRRLDRKPDWSDKLGFIQKATSNLPGGILLDCELFSSGGRRFIPSLFADTKKVKPIIFVFDIIYYNNIFVGDLTLKQRKTILERLFLKLPLRLVKYTKYNGELEPKIKQEHEGVVLKKLDSKYNIGKDAPLATMDWRKIKWR
jgi:ATP-dependent DNA ligase